MLLKRIFGFLSTFIFCFIIWLALTLSFNTQEVIGGLIASFITAFITSRFFIHEKVLYLFNPVKFFWLIVYIPIILKEIFISNLKMAKINISPKLPQHSGIVKVPTDLTSEYGLAMLSNSVTLNPGTISIDVADDAGRNNVYIHGIDVRSCDPAHMGDTINGSLEPWVRRIWR